MNISQILEKSYSNQIKNIKKEKNLETKIKQIGALILDVGKRSIKAVAKACGCTWRFAKKCYTIVKDNLEIISNKHLCGRKSVKEIFPNLEKDLKKIVEDYCSTANRIHS